MQEEKIKVESSMFDYISYDKDNKILSVYMKKRNEPYKYLNVPFWLFQGFLFAESKGKYYNNEIKSKYETLPRGC